VIIPLESIGPNTIQFTDRPQRLAADVATALFVQAWAEGADGFEGDPPNAGLSVVVDGKVRTATVELLEPKLEGDVLTYRIRVIEGEVPKAGGATSLFIDGGVYRSGELKPVHPDITITR
jgi:hypothetical protein